MKLSKKSTRPEFTCLPNWLQGKLSPNEGWLLWNLKTHFPNIFPGIETLARESGMCPKTVSTTLRRLENLGLIAKTKPFQDGNTRRSNSYELLLDDSPKAWALGYEHPPEGSGSLVNLTGVARQNLPGYHGKSYRGSLVNLTDEEEQAKKIQSKKSKLNKNLLEASSLENPPSSPPIGGIREMSGPSMTGLEQTEQRPQAEPAEKFQAPPQSAVPTKSTQVQAASLSIETEHIAAAAQTSPAQPTEQVPKKRAGRFTPSADLIPAVLLPVQSELLNFWELKSGEHSGAAWKRLISGSQRIQADPRGGTEILRGQLREGAEAGWKGVSFANWEKFGTKRKPDPTAGTGFSAEDAPWLRRNLRGFDLVAAAEALAEARDRQRALRYQAGEQQASETILGPSPCVVDAELVA